MKTIFTLLVMFIISLGFLDIHGQRIPTYPIPSYNVNVNGYANFMEGCHLDQSKSSKAKKELNVIVKSGGATLNCQATVWIYSLDQTTVLGPYTVTCGQTLTVQVDDREWGVLVESEEDVVVDVWMTVTEEMKSHVPINELMCPDWFLKEEFVQ